MGLVVRVLSSRLFRAAVWLWCWEAFYRLLVINAAVWIVVLYILMWVYALWRKPGLVGLNYV